MASAQELDTLIERGNQLLATGDIAAARLFYQRAAEQGSGAGATAVGKTYDPLFLEQAHVLGARGDLVMAMQWYRKAISLGDHRAESRLKLLSGKSAG
jgi:TPR repeat protein